MVIATTPLVNSPALIDDITLVVTAINNNANDIFFMHLPVSSILGPANNVAAISPVIIPLNIIITPIPFSISSGFKNDISLMAPINNIRVKANCFIYLIEFFIPGPAKSVAAIMAIKNVPKSPIAYIPLTTASGSNLLSILHT